MAHEKEGIAQEKEGMAQERGGAWHRKRRA